MHNKHTLLALSLLLAAPVLSAAGLVAENYTGVAHDKSYFTHDTGNSRIIFSRDDQAYAEHAAALSRAIQASYERSFAYSMDSRLYVGLMSSHNQIANGFSTQFPVNRQINYGGGAQMVDYFSASSWLDILLLHETAHNYQINAKDNIVSRGLHHVVGNGSLMFPLVPAVLPNLTESSFILEGNAVLNESWHGLGGRLYSGRYRAMTNVHANAGFLTRARLYNNTLNFPYGEGHYIFGSQYQYFLADKYGLDKTNQYFKNRSRAWFWPFMVNHPTRRTFGTNFNRNFDEWVTKTQSQAADMQMADGDIIARSQYFSALNTHHDEIVFLASPEGVRAPLLSRYHIGSQQLKQSRQALSAGKVFEDDGRFYTATGRHTSVWRQRMGLFDNNGVIKKETAGKIIQGYLQDGTQVYFKVDESFIAPQLYVGDQFYAQVNSSVIVHQDQLYYFVQQDNLRTLYRNKEALTTLDAYYAVVADIADNGDVYFIANSEKGSSLYRFSNGVTDRALAADNVIDARLIADNQVLAAAIGKDGYYYSRETLQDIEEQPYVLKLFWDEQDAEKSLPVSPVDNAQSTSLDAVKRYHSPAAIRYESGYLSLGSDSDGHTIYNASFNFSDPLTYNTFTVWAARDDELSHLAGVQYSNNQFFLLFGMNAYYLLREGFYDQNPKPETRDVGYSVDVKLPFINRGYWYASLDAAYSEGYEKPDRQPLSVSLNLSRQEVYGYSLFPNKDLALSLYGVEERDDRIAGLALRASTDLPREFYIGIKGQFSETDGIADYAQKRGVRIADVSGIASADVSEFVMPSLKHTQYAEKAAYGELYLSKVFNWQAYHFAFPLSLRRTAFTHSYRYYRFDALADGRNVDVHQAAIKFTADLGVLNVMNLLLFGELQVNSNDDVTDYAAFRAGVGMEF